MHEIDIEPDEFRKVKSPRNDANQRKIQQQQLEKIAAELTGERKERVEAIIEREAQKWERLARIKKSSNAA